MKRNTALVSVVDLTESVEHMNFSPGSRKKEMAKAVIRVAIQYAIMKRAGFKMAPAKTAEERSI